MSPAAAPRLVALGDLLVDVVVRPSRPLELGTDVPGEVSFRRGGSAANSAAAFARLGGVAALITSLGDDAWARRLRASLRADGVLVHAVRRAAPSGRLAALIDERGERSFVTQRGAADLLAADDLRRAWLRGVDVLHVPAYALFAEPIGRAATRAAEMARSAGTDVLVSCDLSSAAPLRQDGVGRTRARIAELAPDLLLANRAEAAAFLGRTGRRSWPGLLAQARVAVVKDGLRGCRVLRRQGSGAHHIDVAAARTGRTLDSTGAGDAFAAGFLHSLLSSGGRSALDTDRALRQAALAGHRAARQELQRGRPELTLR